MARFSEILVPLQEYEDLIMTSLLWKSPKELENLEEMLENLHKLSQGMSNITKVTIFGQDLQ